MKNAPLLQDTFLTIYSSQIFTENRINLRNERSFVRFAYSNLGCSTARGHITFWRTRSGRWCVAQNASHFPKCFIGFRAIYRWSERRYSYQSTEHKKMLYKTKNASFCTRHYIYKSTCCLDQQCVFSNTH